MLTLEEQLAKLPLDDFSRNVKGNVMKAPMAFGAVLVGAVFVGFIVVIIGYGVALSHFGWPLGSNPEIKPENWGVFGDFLGGTINPLLTFLTFIAVLITLFIQAQELKATREELTLTREEMSHNRKVAESHVLHLKSEADKSDIQRTISVIDESLERRLKIMIPYSVEKRTLEDILYGIIKRKDFEHMENDEFDIDRSEGIASNELRIKRENIRLLINVSSDLIILNDSLKLYDIMGEDSQFVKYYSNKYVDLSRIMVFMRMVKKEDLEMFLRNWNYLIP